MKSTAFYRWVLVGLTGLGIASVIQACGDDEDSTSSSGNTSNTSSNSSNASTGSGMGGGGDCEAGIDNACEMCAADSCTTEAQACADLSVCDAAGEPTSGCLSLVYCAVEKCGGADLACVSDMCSEELEGAGSDGLAAATTLGDCVEMECEMECAQGGAGGAGGAG
jgi:hypothetical protein